MLEARIIEDDEEHGVIVRRPSQKKPRRPGVLPLVAISVGSLLVTFVIIELLFRAMSLLGSPTPSWSDRPRTYFVPESATTLQDFAYAPVKPPKTFRIAVVGDSFSFAPYMQFDDTFAKRLERWLNLNTKQRRVEVVNYGVPRYSTSHEIAVVERALSEGADLILLQVTLNDPEIKPYRPTGLLLNQDTGVPKLDAPIFTYWRSLAFVAQRLLNAQSRREYRDYFFKLFDNPRTWKPFVESMTKLVGRARDAKVPLVAVVFPLFGYVVNDEYPFGPIHQKVASLLSDLQVPTLDITNEYRDMPLDRLQVIPIEDRHPNEIAHRIAAEAIYAWLKTTALLPEEVFAKRTVAQRIGIQLPAAE